MNVSWCLFCRVSPSRSPVPSLPAGMGEHDAAQAGRIPELGLFPSSLPCPASPPRLPVQGRQWPAGDCGCSPHCSPNASAQLNSSGLVGAPLAMVCGTGRSTLTARVTQRQPAGPTMAEVLLGVTALYLHRPSKGGGGVSAGPDTFRTFTPVSSLSLVPLGNADLLLISVQPHWHQATLHRKNLSHCIASNLPLIWFEFLFSPSTSCSSTTHHETVC